MNIEKTLEERSSRYGLMEDNANITQNLLSIIEKAPNYKKLTPMHKEVYHMVFHKIARSVCGDPFYVDNIHDIIGYAKCLEEYLIKIEKAVETVEAVKAKAEKTIKESEEIRDWALGLYKGNMGAIHNVDIKA